MTMDIKITRVGAFNLDEKRRFIDDAEKGRGYLHLPENLKKVDFELSTGFPEKFKYHNMSYDGIANILHFLLPRLELLKEVDFVTRRGLLSSIMDASTGGNYDFLVAKVGSVIYLVDKPWPTGSGEKNINEYCGRRFENFLFADSKKGPPDASGFVKNAESFHMVYKGEFAGHRFIYNAEIDGIDPIASKSDKLNDLRLVEAKTRPVGKSVPTVWSQCYLSGIDKVVLGWKTEANVVKSIDVLETSKMRPKNSDKMLTLLIEVMEHIKTLMAGVTDPKDIYHVNIVKGKVDTKSKPKRYNGDQVLLKEYLKEVHKK